MTKFGCAEYRVSLTASRSTRLTASVFGSTSDCVSRTSLSVDRGNGGLGIEPRDVECPGRRRCREKRKATRRAPSWRGARRPRAVRDPMHAGTPSTREPGGPWTAWQPIARPQRQGQSRNPLMRFGLRPRHVAVRLEKRWRPTLPRPMSATAPGWLDADQRWRGRRVHDRASGCAGLAFLCIREMLTM